MIEPTKKNKRTKTTKPTGPKEKNNWIAAGSSTVSTSAAPTMPKPRVKKRRSMVESGLLWFPMALSFGGKLGVEMVLVANGRE